MQEGERSVVLYCTYEAVVVLLVLEELHADDQLVRGGY